MISLKDKFKKPNRKETEVEERVVFNKETKIERKIHKDNKGSLDISANTEIVIKLPPYLDFEEKKIKVASERNKESAIGRGALESLNIPIFGGDDDDDLDDLQNLIQEEISNNSSNKTLLDEPTLIGLEPVIEEKAIDTQDGEEVIITEDEEEVIITEEPVMVMSNYDEDITGEEDSVIEEIEEIEEVEPTPKKEVHVRILDMDDIDYESILKEEE